ncbi:MAG TPA: hypothetical protein VN039_02900 [Nitrospira sp.]|nr:hypothetical protein [Nitrospira sp.]
MEDWALIRRLVADGVDPLGLNTGNYAVDCATNALIGAGIGLLGDAETAGASSLVGAIAGCGLGLLSDYLEENGYSSYRSDIETGAGLESLIEIALLFS